MSEYAQQKNKVFRDRVRRDPKPRPFPDHRLRSAGGRPDLPGLRYPVREIGEGVGSEVRRELSPGRLVPFARSEHTAGNAYIGLRAPPGH
jgi:hypothetical protein